MSDLYFNLVKYAHSYIQIFFETSQIFFIFSFLNNIWKFVVLELVENIPENWKNILHTILLLDIFIIFDTVELFHLNTILY